MVFVFLLNDKAYKPLDLRAFSVHLPAHMYHIIPPWFAFYVK